MDPTDPPTIPPPVNRAVAWFRELLNVVPVGFFLASLIGVDWLGRVLPSLDRSLFDIIWLVLNVMFIAGTGWFKISISDRAQAGSREKAYYALNFLALQVVLIPFFLVLFVVLAAVVASVIRVLN